MKKRIDTHRAGCDHIAIVEQLNGKAVDWLEKVSDGEYDAANGDAERKHI